MLLLSVCRYVVVYGNSPESVLHIDDNQTAVANRGNQKYPHAYAWQVILRMKVCT